MIGEGVTQIGMERWFALIIEEEVEAKPIHVHRTYLGTLIDMLFMMLPTIRNLRHQKLLQQEKTTKTVVVDGTPELTAGVIMDSRMTPKTTTNTFDSDASTAVETIDLLDQNLRAVEKVPLIAGVIQKSAFKLEQWSMQAALQTKVAQQADNPEVRKTQEAISEKLGMSPKPFPLLFTWVTNNDQRLFSEARTVPREELLMSARRASRSSCSFSTRPRLKSAL